MGGVVPCRTAIPLCCCTAVPQVPDLVKEYMAGTTLLDKYITHRMKFSQASQV